MQLPHGDSGHTTFFISDESDFQPHAARIAAQPVVKIMRRIRCRQLTIEGCVTRHGTLVGPLQTELVGCPDLTPFSGGWCGNEVFAASQSTLLTADIRQQAQQATVAMGEQLRQVGYRGCFGLDLLLDQDTRRLYLGEMNPRITGATPMTSQAMLEADSTPLLLFHLLEWFGAQYELDVAAFNRQWLRAEVLSKSKPHLILGAAVGTVVSLLPLILWAHTGAAALSFVGVMTLMAIRLPTYAAYVMDAVPPGRRALMSGASEMANGLGFAVLGLGGGQVISAFGYRALFLFSAGLTLAGAWLFAKYCRPPKTAAAQPAPTSSRLCCAEKELPQSS